MSKKMKVLVSTLVAVLLLTVGGTAIAMAQEEEEPAPQVEANGLLTRVAEILDIPEEMQVITLVIVGKQAESIGPLLTEKQAGWERERPERLPVEEFAYVNRFAPPEVRDECRRYHHPHRR